MVVYSRAGTPAEITGMTLFEMGQIILDRMESIATGLGMDLPERRIIYPSPVPVDCAQVAVVLLGWQPTVVSDSYVGCQTFRWAGSFAVQITRCTPAVSRRRNELPAAADMIEAGRIASDDSDILVELVRSFSEIGPEMALQLAAPDGGFQTVQLTVSLPATGGLD